jgi:hypothetical protein
MVSTPSLLEVVVAPPAAVVALAGLARPDVGARGVAVLMLLPYCCGKRGRYCPITAKSSCRQELSAFGEKLSQLSDGDDVATTGNSCYKHRRADG